MKRKVKIGLAVFFSLLAITLTVFILTPKRPYKNYDDNVYVRYQITYYKGENVGILFNGMKETVISNAIFGTHKERLKIYDEVVDYNTGKTEFKYLFTATLYITYENGLITNYIRLNEIPYKIQGLVIKEWEYLNTAFTYFCI